MNTQFFFTIISYYTTNQYKTTIQQYKKQYYVTLYTKRVQYNINKFITVQYSTVKQNPLLPTKLDYCV